MQLDEDDFEGTNVTVGSRTETIGELLGSGREGFVYEIQGNRTDVVKIFEPDRRSTKHEKVKEMVRNPLDNPIDNKSAPPSFIWPIETVYTPPSDDFLGYSMTRLNTDEFENAQKFAHNSLDHSESATDTRYLTALNLALKMAVIHANGHAMGDMHHSNILVKDGHVSLIDCDGFHISGRYENFGGETVYPRYEPPDTRSQDDDVQTVQMMDNFGLAIHVFQFLMEGYHPFVAVGEKASTGSTKNAIQGNQFPYSDPDPGSLEPPDRAPSFSWLQAEIQDLFNASFVMGKSHPQYRPSAIDWVHALAQVSSLDTSDMNLDTSSSRGGNEKLNNRQDKWERQRKKRRRQYESTSKSKQSDDLSSSDTPDSQSTQSSTGQLYNRDSPNWAEKLRNDTSTSASSSSSNHSSSTSTNSNTTTTNASTSTPEKNSPDSDDDTSMVDAIVGAIFVLIMLLVIFGIILP